MIMVTGGEGGGGRKARGGGLPRPAQITKKWTAHLHRAFDITKPIQVIIKFNKWFIICYRIDVLILNQCNLIISGILLGNYPKN
jgi:hypothetical protein